MFSLVTQLSYMYHLIGNKITILEIQHKTA